MLGFATSIAWRCCGWHASQAYQLFSSARCRKRYFETRLLQKDAMKKIRKIVTSMDFILAQRSLKYIAGFGSYDFYGGYCKNEHSWPWKSWSRSSMRKRSKEVVKHLKFEQKNDPSWWENQGAWRGGSVSACHVVRPGSVPSSGSVDFFLLSLVRKSRKSQMDWNKMLFNTIV